VKRLAIVCSAAICGFSVAHAQQGGERTTLSGVFTNGMPPGDQKLMPDVEALEKILIMTR
jgi:hypothetical protein